METVLAAFIATLLSFTQPYAIDHGRALSQRETMCLTEAVYYEGRGERIHGATIAYVALNRSAETGHTLCQTVHEHHQFSYFNKRRLPPIREFNAWKFSAYLAVYAQLGLLPNSIGNATSYNEHPVNSWLSDYVFSRKVGHLYFYRRRDLANTPPLVSTDVVSQPAVPRLVLCDSESASRVMHNPHATSVATPAMVPVPPKRHISRMQEADVSSTRENVVVWLPPSVPFPEEPALSQPQVVALASALTPMPRLSPAVTSGELHHAAYHLRRVSAREYHRRRRHL